MTSTNEETKTQEAVAAAAEPKPPKAGKKATAAPKKPAVVAPAKKKLGKKTTPGQKAPKAAKGAKTAKAAAGTREGSKTAIVRALLKRSGGATLAQIMDATSWQARSVRGIISGTVGKKMDLPGVSAKTRRRDPPLQHRQVGSLRPFRPPGDLRPK